MTPQDISIHLGDCIEVMHSLPDNSVDSVVTDPPYGIRFMGKAWDGADIDKRAADRRAMASHAPDAGPNGGHKSIAAEAGKYDLAPEAMRAFQEFSAEWAREAYRVLKPGGHLLSFASARTYHRMASGIEDAGFDIRDQIMWVYGSGFPKSHNGPWGGTALKPAHEPICVARKPLIGTVAANVLEHGTGALNIDGCRVSLNGDYKSKPNGRPSQTGLGDNYDPAAANQADTVGRWPANLIHDGSDEVVALFPANAGASARVKGTEASVASAGNVTGKRARVEGLFHADTGSAARFFYCAKISKADRNEGCEALPQNVGGMVSNTSGQHITRRDEGYEAKPVGNHHPTVKPTDLMAYLCRLVTPVGGIVLDPFMGSGSTGKAAVGQGFQFIGIDMSPEYVEIAKARISHASEAYETAVKQKAAGSAQLDIFEQATI